MSGCPRRLLGRGLLLAFGGGAAWLVGASIGPAVSSADAAVAASPSPMAAPTPWTAPPNPLALLLDPITQTIVPSAQALVSSTTAPIIGPVVSQLGGTPLGPVVSQLGGTPPGGVLSPPPVPIQITPVLAPITGVLPIGVSAPSVAELTGARSADQPQLGRPRLAGSPMDSGSVPGQPTRSPDPSPVPLPSSPATPAPPAPPLPPTLPAPGPDGPGSSNGAGLQLRGGIDTVVPIPSPRRSPAASRAPPGPDSITPCLIADKPSYSPD